MKKLLILFGILDVMTLALNYRHISKLIGQLTNPYWTTIGSLLTFISLILSAYFLIKQRKLGLWLTYGQFPFRVLFVIMSFGFLLRIVSIDQGQIEYLIFMWILLGLEIGRLICTIYIHKKDFRRMTPTLN
jgi:hypothetical protein